MTDFFGIDIIQVIKVIIAAAATFAVGVTAARLTKRFLEKAHFPAETEMKFARIVKYTIYLSGSALILAFLAGDIIGALVGLGVIGLAISFGLAGVINQYMTGVAVILGRNFKVGDKIRLAFFEGTVVKIGIGKTVLQSENGEIILVPTGFFLSNPVARKATRTKQTE